MGVTFRFIASPDESQNVLRWFGDLVDAPEVHLKPHGALLYFRQFGKLATTAGDAIDVKRSPVASVLLPHVLREVLWTVGEVHFLADRMRSSLPGLQRVLTHFQGWLRTFPLVFRQPRLPETTGGSWDYYLEGSSRNRDSDIFAFPEGMSALEHGQYFVSDSDSESRLDDILKKLKLRGVVNFEQDGPANSAPRTR
jgi:hypothetical protein